MKIDDVMQQLANRLDTIPGLRVFAYPPAKITPPAAVVTYPADYSYDATYGRGMDKLQLPVVALVGKVSDRATRGQITKYVDGAGAASFKAVLEGNAAPAYTAFDSVRVARVVFDVVAIGAVEYLSATFTLDIAGQGSA